MKICSKCNIEKELTAFNRHNENSFKTYCKQCQAMWKKAWYEKNKEKEIAYSRAYYWANKEKQNKNASEWKKRNPERHVILNSKRKAKSIQATPKWANLLHIEAKYSLCSMLNKNTAEKWHVDHIVPLQGKNVCGLHVEYNLKVIPAIDNLKKSNRLES